LKPKELINQVENILKENGIDTKDYFQIQESQLRILGLCYGEHMYTKRCRGKRQIYTAKQVVDCTELAIEYLKTKDWTQIDTSAHFINTILLAVKIQLDRNYFNKEELDVILEEIEI